MPAPLPAGYSLDHSKRSGKTAAAPPPGYRVDDIGTPTGDAHDGDTFGLISGRNARLFGVDAFELGQPYGIPARTFLQQHLDKQSRAVPTGSVTYGRPVVTLDTGGNDIARASVGAGLSLPEPRYLATDPKRLTDYVTTQREAIADERGAYAGTYQSPSDFRHMGALAPKRGKIPMTPQQASEYSVLVRNPKTTDAQLSSWFASQGQSAANTGNILSFMRRNPGAKVSAYFQQRDVQEQPVLPNGPGIATRQLAALNEGIADVVGTPVDLVNGALKVTGLPMSDRPIMGSDWIRDGMHSMGIGQTSEAYAPRSDVERYSQAMSRGVGQSALPIAGALGLGSRLALRGTSALTAASPARMAARTALTDAARNPAMMIAGEVGGGVGANIAGQGADDLAPGNIYAQTAAQVVGGLAGGLGGGLAMRPRPAPRPAAPETPHGYVLDNEGATAPLAPVGPSGDSVGPSSMAMASDMPEIVVTAPVRALDRIDVGGVPHGYTLDPAITGKVGPVSERPSSAQLAAAAREVQPSDVTPIPSNAVASADEAAAIGAGARPEVLAPDERLQLPSYRTVGGRRRNPADLISWLRGGGGLRDTGGDLAHMGFDNKPRDLDFARDEGFLGRLVNPDGAHLDDAAYAAWEAGFFPELSDRPTIREFLDALEETHRGGPGRVFHPDDWEAIDNYHAAQSQRYAVEQARDNGSPLVDDISEPVGPDDLEANRPPATAYEDLPQVGGRVGNINLAHIETPQDIRRALSATEAHAGGFDAARRGTISHAETEALASELGMTPADLLKRRKGQALNAEEALAARQLLAKSSNELVNLAGRAKGGSEADLAGFREAWLRHAAIQEHVTAATAEAGRALSSFRAAAKSSAVPGRIHKLLLEQAGGRDHLEDVASKILDLVKVGEGPGQITKFAADALKPRFKDKLVELWYNSLLSGPQTHVVNITSNLMTAGLQLPEHAGAAVLGGLRRSVGLGAKDRVLFGEVGTRAFGMMQGARDGLRAFARTARTGVVPDHVSKVEAATDEAISGLKGKILRTPTRLMSAEDEFFKAVARRSELAGLALRKASNEGLKGDALKVRVKELLANPSDDVINATMDYARYVTFQRPATGIAQAVSMATQAQPWLKVVVPFVRTPANILAFAAERSPLAPIVKTWRADVAAGGARRDLAMARATMGTGLGALVAKFASDGLITGGGPADDNAKDLMRSDGWQPYSLKIGDRFYSYQRLDPLATTLGTAADLATKGDYMTEVQRNEAAGVITASILQNLSNKTWMSGFSDLIEVLHDPQRYGASYVRNLAGSIAVPALAAQTARSLDPVMRETNSVGDAIKARVPGMSQSLMPRLDVWGQSVPRATGVGPDLLSPFAYSEARNDPVTAEALAIDARIGTPSRKVGGKRLDDRQWHNYREASGKGTYDAMNAAMAGPGWSAMSVDDRQGIVEKLKRAARADARAAMGGAPVPKKGRAGVPVPPQYKLDVLPSGYVLDR